MTSMLLRGTGGISHEEALAWSRRLRLTSERLCVNASHLTESAQSIRAASVSIRRAIAVPCIRGGVDELDPTEMRRGRIRARLTDGRLPVDSMARGVVGASRGES